MPAKAKACTTREEPCSPSEPESLQTESPRELGAVLRLDQIQVLVRKRDDSTTLHAAEQPEAGMCEPGVADLDRGALDVLQRVVVVGINAERFRHTKAPIAESASTVHLNTYKICAILHLSSHIAELLPA